MWDKLVLWLMGKTFIFLIALGSGTRRRRMSHNQGTAGRGKLRIVDHPQFPATDFFEPGREFPCRLRHGCVSFLDDCVNEVRSGTIKFADTNFESPLDIQMNTGDHCFFLDRANVLAVRLLETPARHHTVRKVLQNVWLGPPFGRVRVPARTDVVCHDVLSQSHAVRLARPRRTTALCPLPTHSW